MTRKKTGGPAFPLAPEHSGNPDVYTHAPGMTLRDYFAGQALAGMLAGQRDWASVAEQAKANGMENLEFVAWVSYQAADAMLEARDD